MTFLFGIPIPFSINIDPILGIILLVLIYAVMMSFLLIRRKAVWKTLGLGFKAYELSDALFIAAIFSSSMLILQLIDYIQGAFGLEVGEIEVCNPLYNFFYVSLAPITEELGFRLCLIGVIGLLISREKGSKWLRALVRPKGNMEKGLKIHSLIIFSAILFAYFHLLGGWKAGKFAEALFTGYVLGRVYYSRGIGQSIMLHWSFNFFTSSFYCFDIAYGTYFSDVLNWLIYPAGIVTILLFSLLSLSGIFNLRSLLHL